MVDLKNTILKNGFGIVPRTIMTDKSFSIEARALFAYFASFSLSPERLDIKTVCNEMQMSEKEFHVYLAELNKLGKKYGIEIRLVKGGNYNG